MNSGQMKKKIETLEAQNGALSKSNQRLLAHLKASLPNVIADEAKRKASKLAGQNYGESKLNAPKREPVDDGLTGQTWVDFFNRYCDPKRLAPATLDDAPVRTRKPRTREVAAPIPFSLNGRRVVIVSAPRNADAKPKNPREAKAAGDVPAWRAAAAKKAWETMRAKKAAAAQVAA